MGLQGAPPPLRPLEVKRATKWRGGGRVRIEKILKAEQAAKAAYKLIARRAIPPPFEPSEPGAASGGPLFDG